MEARELPNPAQQLVDIAMRLRNQHIDRQVAALAQRMNQEGVGDAERLELLRQQQELRGMKKAGLG